jgi:multisubunit Na+/H+ antiporter MnhE subunit
MYKKFGQLSFIIGLFFSIVSLILFGNALLSNSLSGINLYTAIVFILFGLAMMFIENKAASDQ